ncbi:NupC/NupG family nucleoside CNT transporter [Mesobacillus foraminis]|uniref:CNT family concentrative nucleoside transporter/nucleoside transport protein n=1 Tax=Mesobacillus foraminis TaxID=279826 RepID=A0A4R2B6X7_9BACI|nr:nucleoside transporter C-terminal domain-containing protein [Mesobacillus foraminis]TCN21174.1 CNT family concentrative nucleoside transporter/nucleoside transport protein [Mesobacillus foraminis]
MDILIAILGIIVLLGLPYVLSKDRKNINLKAVAIMLALQFALTWFMFNTTIGQSILNTISAGFNRLLDFATVGVEFVFGGIATDAPFVFFFNVSLVIIFFSTLLSILTYLKILPLVIRLLGGALSTVTGLPKVESFNAVNSIFFGQSEALLTIKSQFFRLSRDRLYTVCASAMGSVSASTSGSYMQLLPPQYVLGAMVLNAFSALIIASILMPVKLPKEEDIIEINKTEQADSFFEAMSEGAIDGLKIAGIVAGMLIAFIATMEMVNFIISGVTRLAGYETTLQEIFGFILYPLVFLSGVPANEAIQAGGIMGTKIVLNEFVAMLSFQPMIPDLSEKTVAIVSTFLISFANFSSIGIIAGSVKAMDPEKGRMVSGFGFKLLFGATLASFLSATIVGLFI